MKDWRNDINPIFLAVCAKCGREGMKKRMNFIPMEQMTLFDTKGMECLK